MAYRVLLGQRAEKSLRALPRKEMVRLQQALLELEEDPFTPRARADIKRLKGTERLYRIPVGPWRAVYGIVGKDVIGTDLFRKKRGYDL